MMMLTFSINAQITTVGLIGSATPGGWDADTSMVQDVDSSNLWTMSITLTDGEAKFRANDAWDVNWGDVAFPIGVGTQNGPNIPVIAGDYTITFNSNTGAYYFSVASDIGIIGSATPTGWDSDVNLFQSTTDTNEYYITLELVAGEAKFRANDAWDINWGSTDFPSGIGVQNGPNIPVSQPGLYIITFNKSTGAYNFDGVVIFTTVGIIGSGTPGGDTPTPMIQDPNNADLWTLSAPLSFGDLQFSGNDGEVVWGGTDFPTGVAVEGGTPIPVTTGDWLIEFNTESGAYSFTQIEIFQTVGIIGDATPGGWDNDTDMVRDAGDSSLWSVRLVLTDGEAKFRANDAWDVNWGSGDFPTGVATRNGPNIPITAGEYIITFNSLTGEYNFRELIIFTTVGLIGTGSPLMNWDTDVDMTQDPNDENIWLFPSIDLVDGEVKFRAEDAWDVNWGAATFPEGVGVQNGPNIPTVAGTYGVVFNSATGEYLFTEPFTATKEILSPSSIKAFPNPASDFLNIDLNGVEIRGEIRLNVFDMSGRLVFSELKYADTLIRVRVSQLQNGNYTLQMSNENYIIGKQFVILK